MLAVGYDVPGINISTRTCLNFSSFSTDPEESGPKRLFFISVIDSRLRVVVIVGTPWEVGGGLLHHTYAT